MAPGSEVFQLVTAAELAEGRAVELWLNMLLSEDFEALGVASTRRAAAELRGDTEAANMWRKFESAHLRRVTSPSKARIYRIARRTLH